MREYLWTRDGARLQYQSSHVDAILNWLFIPGGPGLGSEALAGLTTILKDQIPGTLWHFDFPGDGSNLITNKSLSHWHSALTQAIAAFDSVVLVAHSSLGMFVQTIPELELLLSGLVLIGSSPDGSWQAQYEQYCKEHQDQAIITAEQEYAKSPNNESLRRLIIAGAKQCFATDESISKGQQLFQYLPINHEIHQSFENYFVTKKYRAAWVPQDLPTLIIAGSEERLTPLRLFREKPEYLRDNILLREILGAGHYPWFENPRDTVKCFLELTARL